MIDRLGVAEMLLVGGLTMIVAGLMMFQSVPGALMIAGLALVLYGISMILRSRE
jgi:hypothetical protein